MRRVLLVGLVGAVLAVPASAEAAVILDPGTKLTVVCEKRMPFRGLPFTATETRESLPQRYGPGLVGATGRRLYAIYAFDTGTSIPRPTVAAGVKRLKRRGTFRVVIGSSSEQSVHWRGC